MNLKSKYSEMKNKYFSKIKNATIEKKNLDSIQNRKPKNINGDNPNIEKELKQKKKIQKYMKIISGYKAKNHILFILYFILIFPTLSLSKNNFVIRRLNYMEEIIITISGPGSKSIFSTEFTQRPDEVYLGTEQISYTNSYYFPNNENTVKVYFNTVPQSLKYMFKSTSGITKIDLSNFDTSNVLSMEGMFQNCQDLEYLNLNGMKTSSVNNMESMFEGCKKLESLDLSSFETSSVLNMKNMFNNCENLAYLDVSSFDTSSVSDMTQMFSFCKNLESIDVSNFIIHYANTYQMFSYCVKVKSIKFSDTNTMRTTDMGNMFWNCNEITSIDLSNFDTTSCTNMEYLFDNCYRMALVDISSFSTSSVKSFKYMFSYCADLQSLDLSHFDTASVTDMEYMFRYCENLVFINLNSFIINSGTNVNQMFQNFKSTSKMCYNEDTASLIKEKFGDINNDCSDICFSPNTKLISESNKCISDCNTEGNTYIYEYKNKCYSSCPEGTTQSSVNQYLCIKTITCEHYYNIDKTECFDSILDGYFLYDSQQNILDKCHDYCKTCNQKETEGNTNCLTCKDNYYFYKGNCLEECTYGFYMDDLNNKICTCNSNIKCKECSEDNSNLCISCNENYYQKYEDYISGNSFFECYNELEKYYLQNNYFYSCYPTCKKCSGEGNSNNHNCDECLDNYIFINETNKENNCYIKCDYYYYFDSNNEYKCTETNSCANEQNKLIRNKGKCIDKCINDDTYINEYNNECIKDCPENTINENHKCIEKGDNTLDNSVNIISNSSQDVLSGFSAEKFFLGLYNSSEQSKISKDDIIKNIRENIINRKLDTLISNVIIEKQDTFIIDDNTLFQITTSDNQNKNNYTNMSTIHLGDCEKILKDKYKIDDNETLIIFKIDYNVTGLLIPIIGYEVYHPRNKSKLDLSYCEESSINYNIPVTIDEDNLFKYDPNSDYYSDDCSTYTTDNGTDILLNDRKEEFSDNNMSLCENLCEYSGYDQKNKKAICECGIRYKEFILSEIDKQNDLLANNFTSDNSTSNVGTMKCYELVFSKDGLITNIGSYILLFIILFHIISIFIFYKCGQHIIGNHIQDILKEKKILNKPEDKKIKNRKSSIYNLDQNLRRSKKKLSSTKINPKPEKSKIKKRKSNNLNPTKKWKRKSSRIIIQENTNISNNQKSFTKLILKESRIGPHRAKKKKFYS